MYSQVVLAYRKMPTRQMAHSNLYMFLSAATYIQLSSLDIFYTGSENCIAGGPQFPSKYYITYAGTMQSFFGLIGVSLFQVWLWLLWIPHGGSPAHSGSPASSMSVVCTTPPPPLPLRYKGGWGVRDRGLRGEP